jgi:drug/metabolite transporter (DMT)-like permease
MSCRQRNSISSVCFSISARMAFLHRTPLAPFEIEPNPMGVMMVRARASTTALVAVALFSTWIIWGSTYLAIKIALPQFPPFFQMGSRFVAAGVLLLIITYARERVLPDRVEWRSAIIIGTLLIGGGAGATAYAQQTVASGLAASFVAFEPALILLMSLPFGHKPTRTEWAAILMGAAGVVLLTQGAGFTASPNGLIAMVVATVSWSAGSVLSVYCLKSAKGFTGAAAQMICGGALLLVLSGLTHETFRPHPGSKALGAWVYLVLFGSVIAYSAFLYLLSHVRMALAMSYTFVNPLIALLCGSMLGQETFAASELVASGAILASVLLLLRPAERNATAQHSLANTSSQVWQGCRRRG